MDSAAITGTMPAMTQFGDLKPTHEGRSEHVSKISMRHSESSSMRSTRSVDAFQHEMRTSIKAKFKMKFSMPQPQPQYAATPIPVTADSVAKEALGTAKAVVAEQPLAQAAKSIISFRSVVKESAEVVSNTLGATDDVAEMDDAVAQINDGLDELDAEIANTQPSTTSVLAVDTSSRESTKIQIRTQEGDIVKFSLRREDSMTAGDASYTNGDMSATSTSIELSGSSRMRLSVEGDLNDSELEAIKNVFAQAESIANNFYGGDLAKAFNEAQGFEFDTSELAKVKMRFRSTEVSNTSYLQAAQPPATGFDPAMQRIVQITPEPAPIEAPVAPVPAAGAPVKSPGAPIPATPIAPVVGPDPIFDSAAPVEPEAASASAIADDAMSGFFQMVSNFMRTVSESFEVSGDGSSIRYQHSESFKLELLKTVIITAAPAESLTAAANAETTLDALQSATVAENELTINAG